MTQEEQDYKDRYIKLLEENKALQDKFHDIQEKYMRLRIEKEAAEIKPFVKQPGGGGGLGGAFRYGCPFP